MSHEIENMFSVQKTPWHGLGKVIDKAPTIEEGIKLAGLDWKVTLEPMYVQGQEVPGYFATVRDIDNSVLGVVQGRYNVLQNSEAFAWFNPFLESGEATLESAGSLRDGKRVWVLAKIANAVESVGKDDPVEAYILLSNSHDGTLSVRCGFTPIRVVCQNTLSWAHSDSASKLLKVRHTQNMMDTLETIRDTMNLVRQEFHATSEQYQLLASRNISTKDLEKYVNVVFKGTEEVTDKDRTDNRGALAKIVPLFETSAGSNLSSANGTAWGAYNAVTNYLSHEAGRSLDTRYNSLWYGANAEKNAKALTTALKMFA